MYLVRYVRLDCGEFAEDYMTEGQYYRMFAFDDRVQVLGYVEIRGAE